MYKMFMVQINLEYVRYLMCGIEPLLIRLFKERILKCYIGLIILLHISYEYHNFCFRWSIGW